MTTIDTHTTLGDLVTAHPGLAPELERRGLDYCCGGRSTLDEAARAAGFDPTDLARELAVATGGDEDGARHVAGGGVVDGRPAWADMGPAELTDHIVATHHRYLWDELPRLEALAGKVAGAHLPRHPELGEVQVLVTELRTDLEQHMAKEERILFPAVTHLARTGAAPGDGWATLARPISVMLIEHDRAGDLLARLRSVTGGFRAPSDACASYRAFYEGLAAVEADTHLHVHKENNVLFPAVLCLGDAGADAAEAPA
jgi:regulator of cell morphogenesis and NO signaling